MAKRKETPAHEPNEIEHEDQIASSDGSEDSDGDEMDVVNVEFEWFDPQPAHDFHGIRMLLRQLFDANTSLFDLSALTDLILSQPLLGSTVKVEGNESDPYAFLSVLNMHEHREVPAIQAVKQFFLAPQHPKSTLKSSLSQLLSTDDGSVQIGLVLSERLINVPAQVVPPMYDLLLEEISWALEDKEPYQFTHYLVVSRVYVEVESSADHEESRPRKKSKKPKKNTRSSENFYFHPEDELLEKHALEVGGFDYHNQDAVPDSKRAFQDAGIKPRGSWLLLEAAKFEHAVKSLKEFFSGAA
ncbi:MAG: Mss4p nuclear export [Phylliscum demangeonii]|nr:MAG: Mss4p nuclear export [Phylliscum demangeonii]